jgi:hypothetical protein
MKKLNIYFDIDGVLLGTKSPKRDIIRLLKYCLRKYPNSTYWLTTHCKGGENRTDFALKGEFPDDIVEQIYNTFLPTDWEVLKTEAIDLDSDFIWFDDNLFESEKIILEKYFVLDNFFRMSPKDPKMARKALRFLKKQG